MNLYKDHNLPALHLELGVQLTYIVEAHYFTASRYGLYADLLNDHDIRICIVTQGYLSVMN